MRGSIVAIEGPSAAGKSRLLAEIARRRPVRPLPEAFDRLRPRPSLRFGSPDALLRLELRLLAEEARRYRLARGWAEAGELVLLDSGTLGPLTYTVGLVRLGRAPASVLPPLFAAARRLARKGAWGLPDRIVYLEVPRSERARRARSDPVGHPKDLDRRHAEIGRVERRMYRRDLAPILADRLRFVSGNGAPEEVARRVERRLLEGPSSSPGASVGGRVLRALARSTALGNR